MKQLFLAGFLALACGLPAQAELRIALIDTGKAFDAFYKTKDMASKIVAKRADFEKEVQSLQVEYESAQQEAEELEKEAKDTSTSVATRKSKDAALAQKVMDLQSMEREINRMQRSRGAEIHDEMVRSHQEIADEMMRVITAYVTGKGYDLVLDKTPANSGIQPFPFSSIKVFDLTPEIISRLNAVQPPLAKSK